MSSSALVQQMAEERSYAATSRIPAEPVVRPIDSKRMIEHVVGDIAHNLMRVPNTDPVGLTITVTSERYPDGSTYYVVQGTLPQD